MILIAVNLYTTISLKIKILPYFVDQSSRRSWKIIIHGHGIIFLPFAEICRLHKKLINITDVGRNLCRSAPSTSLFVATIHLSYCTGFSGSYVRARVSSATDPLE